MKLSRESRYALVGLSVLASKPPGTVVQLALLAEEAELPAPFLAKIFQRLTRHGILSSFRGRQRGYALARPPGEITVREILEAVDGQDLFERCIFVTETCDACNPCPLHDTWTPLIASILDEMSKATLADLAVEAVEAVEAVD